MWNLAAVGDFNFLDLKLSEIQKRRNGDFNTDDTVHRLWLAKKEN